MTRSINATPCGCTINTRYPVAYQLREAYHAATMLSARIDVGQAYTLHLRVAHLLGPLVEAQPVGQDAWPVQEAP